MRRAARYILLLSMIGLWSCSITKHIPPGESLYTGADIKIQTDSTVKVNKVEAKSLEGQIEAIIRPKPNSTILGWPYKVSLYYLFGEPKKEKGFR